MKITEKHASSSATLSGNTGAGETLPGDLTIAVIGPDEALRSSVVESLLPFSLGEIQEFSSYPPKLEDLPHLLNQTLDVILVELDTDPEYACKIMRLISNRGTATLMVYSRSSDLEQEHPAILKRCVNAGAREFFTPPFLPQAIREALERVSSRRKVAAAPKRTRGKMLLFCGAKGGAGATSIACNFAIALARLSVGKTILIDLDLPLGDIALYLGIASRYSTLDALNYSDRLDTNFLSKLVTEHSSGLAVLAAPGQLVSSQVSHSAVNKLIFTAREMYEYVIVDAGSKFNITSAAEGIREAEAIYVVTQRGLPELRNANRLISQITSACGPKAEVILNRYESCGSDISDVDTEMALTRKASWKLSNDYQTSRRMQDTSTPIVFTDCSISRTIEQMARSVSGLPEPEKKEAWSILGLFRKKRKGNRDASVPGTTLAGVAPVTTEN